MRVKSEYPTRHGDQHPADGSDPIPGLPPPAPANDTIDGVIGALNPAGFWKLNDTSGTVAHDSSGNGQHLDASPSWQPPTWGAAAGPPGAQTADFAIGGADVWAQVERDWPEINDDFTAGIWAKMHSASHSVFVGQGNRAGSTPSGWYLGAGSSSYSSGHGTQRMLAQIPATVASTNVAIVDAVSAYALDTWYFVAVTWDASAKTAKLYIDGDLDDTDSGSSNTWNPAPGNLYIGDHNTLGSNFTGSYAFYMPVVLTAAQIMSIYTSAVLPDFSQSGKVPVSTGLGGSSWDYPLEVTF